VLGYRIFVWCIRYLGLNFAYFLLLFVSSYFVFASRKAFRAIWYFYHDRLGRNKINTLASIFRNYYLFGQVLIDKTTILAGIRHNFTFSLLGREHLLEMHDGGILISGHVGNWEVGTKTLAFLDKKINLLVFDAEHAAISQYMSDILEDRNVNFIKMGPDLSHMLEIQKALERKEIIAITGDRFVEGNKSVRVGFLGEPAAFPTGPWHIASYFKVPVSYVFAVKTSRRHYRFSATPLRRIPSLSNPMKRAELVTGPIKDYVSELEKTIRAYPLQWYNYYDFWK